MNKEERERKKALLAEALPAPDRTPHLQIPLNRYSAGEQVRREVADNIVAEFRKHLRSDGANHDGPLYARLIEALIAAEAHGGAKAKAKANSFFSPGEVQKCLLCGGEYQPAIEAHQCGQS